MSVEKVNNCKVTIDVFLILHQFVLKGRWANEVNAREINAGHRILGGDTLTKPQSYHVGNGPAKLDLRGELDSEVTTWVDGPRRQLFDGLGRLQVALDHLHLWVFGAQVHHRHVSLCLQTLDDVSEFDAAAHDAMKLHQCKKTRGHLRRYRCVVQCSLLFRIYDL